MDFIEQIFGVSPDGGSGLLEALLLLIPLVAIAAIYRWRRRGGASTRDERLP